jgi:hypothetical protein
MTGFRDVVSGQGANLRGANRSGITVRPLPAAAIGAAAQRARTLPTPPSGAASQQMADLMRSYGTTNAVNLARSGTRRNAGLARDIDVSRAADALAKASWGVNRQASNAQYRQRRKAIASPFAQLFT